jgi:phosphoenolpyruvate carboxylase
MRVLLALIGAAAVTGVRPVAGVPFHNAIHPLSLTGGAAARILAKNEQETDDLNLSAPLSQSPSLNKDREAPLLRDIELLSAILSELVRSENPAVHDLYEEFRQYGTDRASDPGRADECLRKMVERASQITADQAVGVTRTFSIMLNLVNSAEVQHRERVTRVHAARGAVGGGGPLLPTEDSIRGTIDALLKNSKLSKDQIYNQLTTQKVEIVLTAHPTQVQRKSLLRKYRKISDNLGIAEQCQGRYEYELAVSTIRRIISSIWGADEIRRNKPTPQQEAAGGNAVIESVLWDAVPAYLRKLSVQCEIQLGRKLPVDVVPIKFASWIGGDRDVRCLTL